MSITINGVTYSGSNIIINNNVIKIDGKDVTPKDTVQINILVEGNINQLNVDSCTYVDIEGDVGIVETVSGDINCGNVSGNVKTVSGDVRCGNIGGNVKTVSGDVK